MNILIAYKFCINAQELPLQGAGGPHYNGYSSKA